jgi:hypothetical protein
MHEVAWVNLVDCLHKLHTMYLDFCKLDSHLVMFESGLSFALAFPPLFFLVVPSASYFSGVTMVNSE